MSKIENKNNKDFSIKKALLIAIVTAILTGSTPSLVDFIFNKIEEAKLFKLHQLQTYGSLYFVTISGTSEQFLKILNEKIEYVDLEDITFISTIASNSDLKDMGIGIVGSKNAWLLSSIGGLELSERLLGKYREKFEQYKKIQVKQERHYFRKQIEDSEEKKKDSQSK